MCAATGNSGRRLNCEWLAFRCRSKRIRCDLAAAPEAASTIDEAQPDDELVPPIGQHGSCLRPREATEPTRALSTSDLGVSLILTRLKGEA